jgi:hypothetical protein
MPDEVGRPTVMTQDVINKLEQAFSLGASDVEACFFAGISHQTLYNYQDKNPEFIERKKALKEKLVLKARSVIASSMESGDKQTAQWYLERRKKDEFSTKVENEHTGKDGSPISIDVTSSILAKIPSNELEALLDEAKNND